MEIVKKLNSLNGNFSINQNTYINSDNMNQIIKLIKELEEVPSILITPYLINTENKVIYELYYCEFDVELHESQENIVKVRNENNIVSKEVNEKLSTGIIVNKNEYEFTSNEIQKYLLVMNEINFDDEKASDSRLETAKIYYQIF